MGGFHYLPGQVALFSQAGDRQFGVGAVAVTFAWLKRLSFTSGCSSSRGNRPPRCNQAVSPEVANRYCFFLPPVYGVCYVRVCVPTVVPRPCRQPAASSGNTPPPPTHTPSHNNIRSCQMEVVGRNLGCHKWAHISFPPYLSAYVGFHLLV